MRNAIITAALIACLGAVAVAQPLPGFDYPDTETARQHWQPQFGSLPVRVVELDDATTAIALDADFKGEKDRACWDLVLPMDLSAAGRISFEVRAINGGVGGNIGLYFGTPTGWHARFWWGGLPDAWTQQVFRLDSFGKEDEPGGWSTIQRFRFSVWSTGAGKATFLLRKLEALPEDPAEVYLRNGSFEILSGGLPYAWGSGHWGVGHLPWATNMDLWRERFSVDQTQAHDGQRSLRIHNTQDLPLLSASSAWISAPRSAETLVLSAWMKSDVAALPVTLSCGGKSVQVEVGAEWMQASLPAVPRADQMTVVISPKAPGTLWIDAVQLQNLDAATPEFHAAFADADIARREQSVDWSPPRRTPQIAAGRTVTGPVKPATVTIDEHGRVLLDGEPYVQHSLGLEFISDLAILDFVAQSGFRDVCIQIRETVTTEQLAGICDRCAQVGLRVIPWLDGRMTRERFTEHIGTLRDHPALLCWYVYDEPSGERFAEADARYHLARELDPNHPALINYLGSKLTEHTGDIYSTDVYPIPHSSPSAAIGAVRVMKQAADPERKPVWMWLQGTGYAYWMDREPSPRELSCMAYGSLIEGARGIYYFAQVPRSKACFEQMRALLIEVDALTPVICSLAPAPEVECSEPNILRRAFSHDGHGWLLAVNTQAEPVEAQFRSPGAVGQVDVLFEDREIPAADGAWTDTFGPYERRVYRW